MSDVDKWCASQCGALGQLDINDANDREIVREHFSLITEPFGKNTWQCSNRSSPLFGYGKTIAEAECNCITAIFEASQ